MPKNPRTTLKNTIPNLGKIHKPTKSILVDCQLKKKEIKQP